MHIKIHNKGIIIATKMGDIAINSDTEKMLMSINTTYNKPSSSIILGTNVYNLPGEYEKKGIPFRLIDCKNGHMIVCMKLENRKIMILPDAKITNSDVKEIADYASSVDAIKPLLETLQPSIIAFQTDDHTTLTKHFGELEHTDAIDINETDTLTDTISMYCLG